MIFRIHNEKDRTNIKSIIFRNNRKYISFTVWAILTKTVERLLKLTKIIKPIMLSLIFFLLLQHKQFNIGITLNEELIYC